MEKNVRPNQRAHNVQSAESQDVQLQLLEQRIKKSRDDYMKIHVPDEGLQHMKEAINRAKSAKRSRRRIIRRRLCAAAASLLIFLIPNCSKASAQALISLPVLGHFFEVITIRDYQSDDGHSRADVQVPHLLDTGKSGGDTAVEEINRSVEEYTNEILERFEENQKIIGDQGYQSLDISYEVLTDTDNWFTLEITVTEIQGSGYERRHYYHIDKSSGQIASLKDIFTQGSGYVSIINDYIIEEMQRCNQESTQGEVYWIGKSDLTDGFESIDEDQNFYLDDQNRLVIVFDEYEVAPGSMGSPRFIIPQKLIEQIRRF